MTVILAAEPIPEQHVEDLQQQGLTIINLDNVQPEQLATIDIMFGWNKMVGPKILATPNHRLKWIQAASSGVDYLPLATLSEQGIIVSNAKGMHAVPIAQTVMSYILYFTRGIRQSLSSQANKEWRHHEIGRATETLEHRTIMVFGTGQIGHQIAVYAKALGLKTIGINRHGEKRDAFDEILTDQDYQTKLADADFVVNMMPLTPETENFFDTAFFNAMGEGHYFFNLGRGASIDETALMAQLNNGHLAGAAIDVAQTEPLPETSPLWTTTNLVITPHISGYIPDIHERLFRIFEQNLPVFLTDGQLAVNQVDLSAGY